MIMILSGLAH